MYKVCHLTSVHPPFDIRIFYKECISLHKAGFKVDLLVASNHRLCKDGVNVIPVKLPKNRLIRMLSVTPVMLKSALKTKANLFHFHDPELIICGVLLKLLGKKVIFDVHENVQLSIVSKDWIPGLFKPFIRAFYFLMERFCLLFFDELILAEDSYLNYYPKNKSTVVLNYPLVINHVVSSKEYATPIKFVYTGGVSENRGVWTMINLIEMLNAQGTPCLLKIVGPIYSHVLQEQLEKHIKQNNLRDKIILVGKVEFNKVENFLKESDIGLVLLKPIPNYKESLPTKMFEYMQYGLPIIINDFPLYKRYLEQSKAGICIDADKIHAELPLISSFISDTEQLNKMAQCGYYSVAEKFNWMNEEEKLVSVYKKLLN